MGRLTGSKTASDYFGDGQKATNAAQSQGAGSEQQQQSGLRRFLTLFRGSQSRQQQPASDGPAGRAASSFVLAWRSQRAPADVLTVDQGKISVSFANQLAPRWESVATDVVSAAAAEPPSPQEQQQAAAAEEDTERARGRERQDEEDRRRQKQATRLQELQRQATLKHERARQGEPRLEYQPSYNGRGTAAAAARYEVGDAEVLRLGPPSPDGMQPAPLLRDEDLASPPPSGVARRPPGAQTSLKQMLVPTRPPPQKPSHTPPSSQPPECQDSLGREHLRLPPFSRDGASTPAVPSCGGGGLRPLQAGVSPRSSCNGAAARTAPVEQWSDPAAAAAAAVVDADPRVSLHRLRTDAGPGSSSPALGGSPTVGGGGGGGSALLLSSSSTSRRSLAAAALGGCNGPPPPSASASASGPLQCVSMPTPPPMPSPYGAHLAPLPPTAAGSAPLPGAGAPLAVAPSSSSSPPPLEVTLLTLKPAAAAASPTLEIVMAAGGGGSKEADPAAPSIARQRSSRTLTGNGYYGSGGDGGLGTPTLTEEVALATGAYRARASPARRVSTPSGGGGSGGGGSGGGGGGGLLPASDALARRTALLREAFNGAGGIRRAVQNLQGVRSMSSNGDGYTEAHGGGGGSGGGSFAAAAAAPAATNGGEPAAAPALPRAAAPPLGRSHSLQRVPSASSSVHSVQERPSNWDYWKHRSRDTNWELWKVQGNLSSRVRHDLLSRAAAEEEAAAQMRASGSGAGSGTDSSVPGTGAPPNWKRMLETAAAALEGNDGQHGTAAAAVAAAGSGSSTPTGAAASAAAAAAQAAGGGGGGSDGGGCGDRGSCDGAQPPPPPLLRSVTMRAPRAVTPAAKTGRMLLRAATQPPTMVALAQSFAGDGEGGSGDGDGGNGSGSGDGDGCCFDGAPRGASGVSVAPTAASPRAGRRAPAPPPPPPSRLSAEGPMRQPAAAAPASPRLAAAERARERFFSGAAAPSLNDASPSSGAVNEAPNGGIALGLQRRSSPNMHLPNVLPPPRIPPYPGGGGDEHSGPGSPVLTTPAATAATALAPSPAPPYRVTLMGGSVVREADGAAVDTPRRGSLNGTHPRSRRMLFIGGAAAELGGGSSGGGGSGLVPVPPPMPMPLHARESDAGGSGGGGGGVSAPLPSAYPFK
ncbi:hypothetical protein PLESTB_001174500 [Pleodorina starrii]|uniref:Uncharacterized protein n=1 Tax=Pleodorina starrii TaxID=330485 RepID=A0A9W6BRQ9_9CHLO|nr:hypothetical protein PLESTB_001174500 [Pleodorina starrii]GLC64856.1 hypothetical protein PLESTF_000214700 [Pleodorina starrii]